MSSIGEKLLKKWNYQHTGKQLDFKFQSDKKGIGFSCDKQVDFIGILDLKYKSTTVSEKELHGKLQEKEGGDTDSDEEYKKKVLKKRKRNL